MRKLIFIFLIFHVHIFTCTKIPKLLRCTDETCEDRISTGRIIKSANSKYGNLDVLKSSSMVYVRGKNVDSQNTLWLVEQEGYYGFVDLSFIKEIKNTVIEELMIVQNPYDTKVDETEDSDDSTNNVGLFSNENAKNTDLLMENDETENFSEMNSTIKSNKENSDNIKNAEVMNKLLNNNITTLNSQNNDKLETNKANINDKINKENAKIIESSNSNNGIVNSVNIHKEEILNSKKVQDPAKKDSISQDIKSEVNHVKTVDVNDGQKSVKKIDSKEKLEPPKVVKDVKVNNAKEQPIVINDDKDDKSGEKRNLPNINQQNSDKHTKIPDKIVDNSLQNSENDSKSKINTKLSQNLPVGSKVEIGSLEISQITIKNEKQVPETQKVAEQGESKKTKIIDSSKVNPEKKVTRNSKPIENIDMKLEKTENVESPNSLKFEKLPGSPPNNAASENPIKQIPSKINLSTEKPNIQVKSIENSENSDNTKTIDFPNSLESEKLLNKVVNENPDKQITPKIDPIVENSIPKIQLKSTDNSSNKHSNTLENSGESTTESKILQTANEELMKKRDMKNIPTEPIKTLENNSEYPVHSKSDQKSSESVIDNLYSKNQNIQSNENKIDQSQKMTVEINNSKSDQKLSESTNENLSNKNQNIQSNEINENKIDQSQKKSVEIDNSKSDQKSSESTIENLSNKNQNIQSNEINENKIDQSQKKSVEIDNSKSDQKSSESTIENLSNKNQNIQSNEINENKIDQSQKKSVEIDNSKSDQKSSESTIENLSNKNQNIQSNEINENKIDQSQKKSVEIDNSKSDQKSSESTIENLSNKNQNIQSKEINENKIDQSQKKTVEINNSKSDQKSSESTNENLSNKNQNIQSKEINENKIDQSQKKSAEIDNSKSVQKSSESTIENLSNKNQNIQSIEINERKTDQSGEKSHEINNQSQSDNNLPTKTLVNEKGTNSKLKFENNNNNKKQIKQSLYSEKSVKLTRDMQIANEGSMKGDPWLDNSGRPVHDIHDTDTQIRSPLIKLIMKIDILSQLGIKYVASKLGFDSSSKLNQFTNHWLQMPLEGFISIFLLFSVIFLTVYTPKLLKFNRDWKTELIRQSQLLKELELKQQTTEEVRHKLTVQNHNFEKVIDEYKQKINEIQEDSAKNRKTVILEIEKIKKSNESNVKNLMNDLANKNQQCQLLENDVFNKTNIIENLEEDKRQMELQFDDEKSQLEVELSENKRELNRIGCLNDQLKQSFQQLSMETGELKARIDELNEEIISRNDSYSQLEKSFEHLKVFEGLNYEEFNERKSIYLDLTQTKQRLESTERNLEQLNETLQIKSELIQQLEQEKIDMKQTVNRYEIEKSLAIQEKEAAEMKLQVLTEYFKSKEVEMAKTLGHQVIESTQSMDQLDFLKHRIRNLESENEELSKSGQKLKSEIKEAQTFATKCKTEANEEINRLFLRNVNLERSLQTEKEENKKLRTKLSHYCGPTPPRNQTAIPYNHNKDRPPSRQSGISEPVTTFVPLSFIPFTSPQSPIPNTNQFSGRNSVNSKKSNNT